MKMPYLLDDKIIMIKYLHVLWHVEKLLGNDRETNN
jgi:hypothetical protein